MDYDDIPWIRAREWKAGCWYPLPVSSLWLDKLTVVEGYDIFIQDPGNKDDIIAVGLGSYPFKIAVDICNTHNGFNLTEGM